MEISLYEFGHETFNRREYLMTETFLLSLQITALGMGLVFAAIIVLWVMMIVLTSLTADKKAASSPDQESAATMTTPALPSEDGGVARAAAIAVAMALAEQETLSAHALPTPPTAIVSAWQLGMRTRLLAEKGHTRRHSKG
jgi:Na+-transporting methylmalonyl-CoA/oxaloacetate decarboxylase gamma subunit